MTSCGCVKKSCKNCKCHKLKLKGTDGRDIQAGCARILCKKCPCFRREKAGENENLILSDQFQQILNELSSDDESIHDSDLDFHSDSSFMLSDIDE